MVSNNEFIPKKFFVESQKMLIAFKSQIRMLPNQIFGNPETCEAPTVHKQQYHFL